MKRDMVLDGDTEMFVSSTMVRDDGSMVCSIEDRISIHVLILEISLTIDEISTIA